MKNFNHYSAISSKNFIILNSLQFASFKKDQISFLRHTHIICSEIQQAGHSNINTLFTYSLHAFFSTHERRILKCSCCAIQKLAMKHLEITDYSTSKVNFIQFWSPVAPDHCKQTILRTGNIHSTGVYSE